MSAKTLIDQVSVTTTVDLAKKENILNNNGMVLLCVAGTGTGTWSSTVNFYPVLYIGNNIVAGAAISVSVSDATPVVTQLVQTPHATYGANISALTGTASISAMVEG